MRKWLHNRLNWHSWRVIEDWLVDPEGGEWGNPLREETKECRICGERKTTRYVNVYWSPM